MYEIRKMDKNNKNWKARIIWELLKNWDCKQNKNSIEASIYLCLHYNLIKHIIGHGFKICFMKRLGIDDINDSKVCEYSLYLFNKLFNLSHPVQITDAHHFQIRGFEIMLKMIQCQQNDR